MPKKIRLNPEDMPPKWDEYLVENQLIGGVFLVFLEGRDKSEIDIKVKALKAFCKTIKKLKSSKKPV